MTAKNDFPEVISNNNDSRTTLGLEVTVDKSFRTQLLIYYHHPLWAWMKEQVTWKHFFKENLGSCPHTRQQSFGSPFIVIVYGLGVRRGHPHHSHVRVIWKF